MANRQTGPKVLDTYFLEVRARALEIAATLDRIERAPGGADVMAHDPRVAQVRQALRVLDSVGVSDRAEQLQMIFSIRD